MSELPYFVDLYPMFAIHIRPMEVWCIRLDGSRLL